MSNDPNGSHKIWNVTVLQGQELTGNPRYRPSAMTARPATNTN